MSFFKAYIASILLLACNKTTAQYSGNDSIFITSRIVSFKLLNSFDNQDYFIGQSFADKPFTLFIFLSPECPLCQNYSPLLKDLYQQYKDNIHFFGIIPGKAYTVQAVKDYANHYGLTFPLLIDSLQNLTKYLQASITPQVILLNDKAEMLYKGALDNRLQSLGKKRVIVTEHYLKDAIEQSFNHKTVLQKRIKAVGCKINDY